MTNKVRKQVRQKFGGKCAFCGSDLSKGMHIWDIEPIQMVVTDTGELKNINEEYVNLYPACKSCASVRGKQSEKVNGVWQKKKMSIEDFRRDIYRTFQFLRSGGITKNSYGRSVRFGLIIESGNPVVFYFERIAQTEKA